MEKDSEVLLDNKQVVKCASAAYWYERKAKKPKSLKKDDYFGRFRWKITKPKVTPTLTASVKHKKSEHWNMFETSIVAFNDGTRKIIVNIETRVPHTIDQYDRIPAYRLGDVEYVIFVALYAKSKGWKKVWLYRDYDYHGEPIYLIGNRKECCGGPLDCGAIIDTEIEFEH